MQNVFLVNRNVSQFREVSRELVDVDKGMPGFVVVAGQAGRGKTEASLNYAIEINESAIYFPVETGWTPRAMLAALCEKVNRISYGTVERNKKAVKAYFDNSPQLLMVDEADRLGHVDLFEHLRDIQMYSGAPIVLIGEEIIYARLHNRRRLWSRVRQFLEFEPIGTADIVLFCGQSTGLRIDPAAATVIGKRADGDFRPVGLDIQDLERMCRASGKEVITMEMVEMLPNRKPEFKMSRRVRR